MRKDLLGKLANSITEAEKIQVRLPVNWRARDDNSMV
jgi:hypothetical protein